MPLRVLVAGLLPYDSGKTWFSAALLQLAAARGLRAAGYKPVGGFSAWHNYPALRESIRDGVLAGGDARTYARVTGVQAAILNPVAYATSVPDPTRLRAAMYMLAMSDLSRTLALWRVSTCREIRHFYSPEVLEASPPLLRTELSRAVEALAAEASSREEFLESLNSGGLDETLEACRVELETGRDIVIVESFNNAALPYMGLDLCGFDFYVLTAPAYVLIYSGERACRAIEFVGAARADKLLASLSRPLLAEALPPAESIDVLAERLRDSRLASVLLPG